MRRKLFPCEAQDNVELHGLSPIHIISQQKVIGAGVEPQCNDPIEIIGLWGSASYPQEEDELLPVPLHICGRLEDFFDARTAGFVACGTGIGECYD